MKKLFDRLHHGSNVRDIGNIDRISFHRATFRWQPWALCFGGVGGHGTNYEWLGLQFKVWRE